MATTVGDKARGDKRAREQSEKLKLNQGFGASLGRAFEIAVVPVLLAGLGLLVDHLLGTRFVVAVCLGLFGVVGTFVKLYYGYRYDMEQHELDAPWRRSGTAAPVADAGEERS